MPQTPETPEAGKESGSEVAAVESGWVLKKRLDGRLQGSIAATLAETTVGSWR